MAVGKCPKNIKTLKGGVNCIDRAGHTCFCNKSGCNCRDYDPGFGQDFKNEDARREWCQNHDRTGAHNAFCKKYYVSDKVGAAQQLFLPLTDPDNPDRGAICKKTCTFLQFDCESAKMQAGCGGSSDDMMYLALAGLGVLALIVIIR